MHRDLGGAFLLANLGTEIDPQLDGRLARFGKEFRTHDRSNAYVDFEKVVETDFR